MYCDFFGFSEKPFTITPNPQFLFLSSIHREAFAHLLYGIDSHAGFISLAGEVGTGKTTVLRTLLSQLDPERYRSALIFNPGVSRIQLLAGICAEFGIIAGKRTGIAYLDALNRYLLEQNKAGRTVVLVIDEAQNLKAEVLEQIRLISNLETERDKLIQIVLAGQPELTDILNRHDLRQLNQRITVRCQLEPMGLEDTGDYITHRLRVSGCRIPGFFPNSAIKRIYRFSQGIPRLINVVCEQSLVMAWTRESLIVTPDIVAHVIAEAQAGSRRRSMWDRLFGRVGTGR